MSKVFLHFWKNVEFRCLKPSKLYNIDVLKAWDYAKTFFRIEKLQISCTKSDTGTNNYIFWIFWLGNHVCMLCMYYVCIICMYYMYVLYVCIIYMYCMYVLYVCIICMYNMFYMYMLYVCKASWLSLPPGGKNP